MSEEDRRPARYGPFHRRSAHDPSENEKICASGVIWGGPRGNYYAGRFPVVKAWMGPLPDNMVGIEFYTDVPPDEHGIPDSPAWKRGADWRDHPGAGMSWWQSPLLLP